MSPQSKYWGDVSPPVTSPCPIWIDAPGRKQFMDTVTGFVRIFEDILRAGFYEIEKGNEMSTVTEF